MSAESAAELLFVTFIAVGAAGALGIVGTGVYWKSVGKHVADSWPKLAAEGIQIVVGLASAAAGFAAVDQRPHWFRPAVAGVVCVGLWKLLQVLIDNRVKAADAVRKVELAEVRRQATNSARLLAVLHVAVKWKVKRLRKAIQQRGDRPQVKDVRAALTPEPHLDDLLDSLAAVFCDQLPEAERQVRNFRVGVYVDYGGVMSPVNGVSLRDPGANPLTSYQGHEKYFRLDSDCPAHVVQCVRQKGLIVVENCEVAASEGKFVFFSDNQRSYLKSMVSYFIGEVCLTDGTMKAAALVIDTDAPGFFKESEKDAIRNCLDEFGVRIKLELLLLALVTKRGCSSERKNNLGRTSGEAKSDG